MKPGQSKAIAALVGGATHEAAAQAGGVHVQTVRRWIRHDVTFSDELQALRTEAMGEARRVLVANAVDAASELVRLAVEPHSNSPVRLGALKLLLAVAEEGDLEERISKLEQSIAAQPLRAVT